MRSVPGPQTSSAGSRGREVLADQAENRGITFKTASLSVQHENPKLFPEMENLEAKERNMSRQEKIKAAVEELRVRKPHLNFGHLGISFK